MAESYSDGTCNGKVIIFNHNTYLNKGQDLTERKGTQIDVKSITTVFSDLKFECEKANEDLKVHEIKKKVDEYAKEDYSKYMSLIVFVLTHGDTEGLLHAYDETFYTSDVWNPFINCTSLIGKPKIFIFQACRGKQKQERKVMTDASGYLVIPRQKDFLIAYSTLEGMVCYRECHEGTWYIQNMIKELDDLKSGVEFPGTDFKSIDFQSLLIRVNNKLVDHYQFFYNFMEEKYCDAQVEGAKSVGQTAAFVSTLSKRFVLKNALASVREIEYAMIHEHRGNALVIHDALNEKNVSKIKNVLKKLKFKPILCNISSTKHMKLSLTEYMKKTVTIHASKGENSGLFLLAVLLPFKNDTILVGDAQLTTSELLKCVGFKKVCNLTVFPKIVLLFNVDRELQKDGTPSFQRSEVPNVTTEFSDLLIVRAYNTDKVEAILNSMSNCMQKKDEISTGRDLISFLTPCLDENANIESTLRNLIVLREATPDDIRQEFMKKSMGLKQTSLLKPCTDFVGKTNEIETLKQLQPNENGIDALVCGPPGVGKTELIYKFLQLTEIPDSTIIWIHVANKLLIMDSFQYAAKKLNIDGEYSLDLVKKVYSKNIEESKLTGMYKTILVLDEITSDDEWKILLPTRKFKKQILVIVSSFNCSLSAAKTISLQYFSDEEAKRLVHNHISDESLITSICTKQKSDHGNIPVKLKSIISKFNVNKSVVHDNCEESYTDNAKDSTSLGKKKLPHEHEYNKNEESMFNLLINSIMQSGYKYDSTVTEVFHVLSIINEDYVDEKIFHESEQREKSLQLLQDYSLVQLQNNTIQTNFFVRKEWINKFKDEEENSIAELVATFIENMQNETFKTSSAAFLAIKTWKTMIQYQSLRNKVASIGIAIFNCKDITNKEEFSKEIRTWLEENIDDENVQNLSIKIATMYCEDENYDMVNTFIQVLLKNPTKIISMMMMEVQLLHILCKAKIEINIEINNIKSLTATSLKYKNEFINNFLAANQKDYSYVLARTLRYANFLFAEDTENLMEIWKDLYVKAQDDEKELVLKQLLKCIKKLFGGNSNILVDKMVMKLNDSMLASSSGKYIKYYRACSVYIIAKQGNFEKEILLQQAFHIWKNVLNEFTLQIKSLHYFWDTVHLLHTPKFCKYLSKDDKTWLQNKISVMLEQVCNGKEKDEVTVMLLRMLRKSREGKNKKEARHITQRIISYLPDSQRITTKYPYGYVLPGPVEYIAALEIEHDNKVLGWVKHHISLPVITYLKETGADINAGDAWNNTILHRAASNGKLDIVKYLISNNANVNIENTKDWSPLHDIPKPKYYLAYMKNLIIHGKEVLCPKKNGSTPLHRAISQNYFEVTKYLISQKADLYLETQHGWNALHFAVYWDRQNVLKYLLTELKIDTNINAQIALDLAKLGRQSNIAEFLKNYKGLEVLFFFCFVMSLITLYLYII